MYSIKDTRHWITSPKQDNAIKQPSRVPGPAQGGIIEIFLFRGNVRSQESNKATSVAQKLVMFPKF